jgi:predicted CopG family antitoxin
MATKTISLKEEAYRRLKEARRYPGESFSEVVMRATWPEATLTSRDFLALHSTGRSFLRDEELDRIEAAKERDLPPEDKWTGR